MKNIKTTRPPIVAVVGHIDHGKSTLLDYIRQTAVVKGEAGGITQHLSSYEAEHQGKKITFLDTPGHEAFSAMRSRGLTAADVAILVVSAEDGVKPQTLEALKTIAKTHTPYVVAFTKIDKPDANLEKAKMSMLEHQIFLEGLGGSVPFVAVSGKTGEGIPELLDLLLLAAEIGGLEAHPEAPAEGVVIEAHVDGRRGNTATLIIKDGTLKSGEFVVVGGAYAPTRIMENFAGKPIREAPPGTPAMVVGFSTLPQVGEMWRTVKTKKEAEQLAATASERKNRGPASATAEAGPLQEETEEILKVVLPLVIKTDVAGTGEAVLHELAKLPQDPRLEVRVVLQGVGPVSESDVKLVGGGSVVGLIAGFNVKTEREAKHLAERLGVTIAGFDVIYKLTEWLAEQIEQRRPRQKQEELTGSSRVLKFFSAQKGKVVVGGRVEEGVLALGEEVLVLRRGQEIGRGKVTGLQSNKKETKKVEVGSEFGVELKTDTEPNAGDYLQAFKTVLK